MMWELEYLTATGTLRPNVAQLLEEIRSTVDVGRAADLMILIEAAVVPVSGGLSEDSPAVVTALVAGLSRMDSKVRSEALLLLTQIAGSAQRTDSPVAGVAGRRVVASLPVIAAIIELGGDADTAQGIDLISVAAGLSREAAERGVFYLQHIVAAAHGSVKESASRELEEVRRLLVVNP